MIRGAQLALHVLRERTLGLGRVREPGLVAGQVYQDLYPRLSFLICQMGIIRGLVILKIKWEDSI